ncbi:MAG TPA: winged helix-turn-helix domain-containing protein [Candidatus Saccharimonadales bacterium]|nr:winged helix-turn-helix domain-containing protein [Candidatus Saccharimonadales bacterium]
MAHPPGYTPETGSIYVGNGQPTFEIAPSVMYENGYAKVSFDSLRKHLNAFSDPDGSHGAAELYVYIPTPAATPESSKVGDISFYGGQVNIDSDGHVVYFNGNPIELRNLTYRTLEFLGKNAGLVLTRSQIIEGVWGIDGFDKSQDAVQLQVMQIRKKLEYGVIETVKHLGYRAIK